MSNNTDDENSLSDIFCLAHQWLLEDLVTICTKLMSERVNSSNVFQLLDFAKQYDNDSLSNCAKRFLATNLPNVLWREEFCKVEEEVITEVFSDPIIFCHDDYAWLEAVRAWADDSDEKLGRILPSIPLHLLSAEEKEKIYKDQTISKTIKSHIEKVSEDTEVTHSLVQYIPIDMFSLNEEPGWLMHTMKDKIVIERMEQFCKTDDHCHLSRGGVERAMQAFYGSNCYMFFESECPASNNRYSQITQFNIALRSQVHRRRPPARPVFKGGEALVVLQRGEEGVEEEEDRLEGDGRCSGTLGHRMSCV